MSHSDNDSLDLHIAFDPLRGAAAFRRSEIVFIESDVPDLSTLLAGIDPGKEVHVLDAGRDGLQQIAGILHGRDGVEALHLISHGERGAASLGSLLLGSAAAGSQAATLRAIGASLNEGADILLYGCEVGAGASGRLLLDQLAVLTGADVAASSDRTGTASRGGDWDLEVRTGNVDTVPVVDAELAAQYLGILALTNVTVHFESGGNFTDRGDPYGGAGSDVVYQVSGNAGYVLQLDGTGGSVYSYANGGSNDYVTVSTNKDVSLATILFSGGNVFTLTSLVVDDFSTSNQTLTFKAYTAGTTLTGTTSISLDKSGKHTVNFDGGFANITTIKVTTAGSFDAFGLDDLAFSAIQAIDNTPPVVTGVSSSTANGTYKAGQVIAVQVSLDETVYVTGTPQLTLETGSTDRTVNYSSGSGTSTLTFNYTVQAGDTSADLDYLGTGALVTNGGTIKDAAGNAATLTLATPGAANSLGNNKNIVIDGIAPTVTDANISISGASGTGGAYRIGDTITATWNNTAGGDNNTDSMASVTVDFSAFGGGAAVTATNSSNTWTATYTIVAGATDGGNRNVSVTATDAAGNATTTADTTNATVDNVAPTVTNASIGISGASGTGGAYRIGDTVTATWNNTAGGDNNADTISGVTVDFSAFGGGAAVAASNSSGTWTATYTIVSGAIDGSNRNVSVTATDNAGNTTTTADTTNATVDNVAPTVTNANIGISGASGNGGAFKTGDTVTATWNNTAGGDNNADTISGVTVDFSAFGGGAAVAASNSGGTWTATYTIVSGAIDGSSNRNVSVTAADNAGNATTTADTTNATVDNQAPAITFSAIAFSSDTGSSSSDFITATAAQTITATLSGTPGGGGVVLGSLDNGATWTDITAKVSGTTLSWNGVTLASSNTLRLKVSDAAGNDGTVASQAYVLDTGSPAAPGTPDLASGSDSGTSSSDDVTSSTTPTITGTAEAGSTVTLYDSDGTTVLGTGTATGGNWSITTSVLSAGSHTLTAKAADTAGNLSTASSGLAITVDNAAPTGLNLSSTTAASIHATSTATVATLSATDGLAVTYSLAVGNGTNDADNGSFTISGTSLRVGGSSLSAGTYKIYLAATDAAGNVANQAFTFTVVDAPTVSSIVRSGGASSTVAGSASSVAYTVTFSESVTGVDTSDFSLTASGTAAGNIAGISGSGTTYTVTVDTLTGDGTLRLDLNSSGTGIQNGSNIAIAGGYTAGSTYTLDHTAPSAPSTPDMTSGTDSGSSNSDDNTSSTTPTFTGTAEAGSTVTLYDTDGTTVLGTATATGGNWSITSSALSQGSHTLTAKASDAAGNTSTASSSLAAVIDATAPTPTVATAAFSADTGASATDFLTNTAAQTLSGTLSANLGTGEFVEVSMDNGSTWSTATGTVGQNTWSYGTTLAGSDTLRVRVTDTAGNSGTAYSQSYTLDTTVPTTTVSTVAFSDDTGASPTDFVTRTAAQTLSGTLSANLVAGELVELSLDNGSTWTTASTAVGQNTWSLSGVTLAASNTLKVRVADLAGNTSAALGQAFVFDSSAPTAPGAPDLLTAHDSGTSGTDDITSNTTPTFTGTAEADSTVTLYDTDGSTVLGTATATGGNWSITSSSLSQATHTLTAKATDLAGNTSAASSGLSVKVDTTAPTCSITVADAALSGGETSLVTFAFTEPVSGFDNADLTVPNGTLTAVASSDGGQTWTATFTPTASVLDNTNLITLDNTGVADLAGNAGSSTTNSNNFTINTMDNAGPVFASAVASGSGVVLTYTDASLLDAANLPAASAFVVTRNGTAVAVTSVAVDANAKTVALQLGAAIEFAESLTVAYTDPTAGNDAHAIQDALGNDAASLAAVAATNTVPDSTAPSLASAAVNGSTLTLTYADNDQLDVAHPPAAGAFSVMVGGTPVAVTAVSVAAGSVSLNLAQAARAGQVVSVSYTDPSLLDDAAAIQDRAGNDAPGFSNVVASNSSPPLLSATVSIDDTLLTSGETATVSIVFSLPVVSFDLSDLGTPGGTVSGLASTDNIRWTATLTPAANTSSSGQVVTLNLGGVAAPGGEVPAGVVISNAFAVNTVATSTSQDGVQVSTQVAAQPDGSTITTQSSPPVPATRAEDPSTPNGQLADIVVAGGDGQAALLTLGLSPGIGFRSEASSGGTLTLRDRMVAASQAHEPDAGALQALIANGIDAFLPTLAANAQVALRTVSFQQAPGTTSPGSVVINGAQGHGEGSAQNPQRHEAVVLDLRGLAAGTQVQLDQVEFALVIGAARITGGTGQNFVVGDAMNQFIVLGAEDDVLRGGGGDDTVGSKGGNDKLHGDEGNDLLVGGSGDDTLDGGSGNDVLQGGASDAGTWTFQLDAQGRIATHFATAEALLGGPLALSRSGAWTNEAGQPQTSDDRLAFSFESTARLETVALLYRAAVGQLPSLNELNAFSTSALGEQQLAQLAHDHLLARGGLQAASTEARVKALIEAAWGSGSATAAWVAEGTRFITSGGLWTDGLLFLIHAGASRARVTDAQGNLALARPYATGELGWGGDSGNDQLRGGSGNDRLVGGTGNDLLDGGGGTDTAVFTGSVHDYQVRKMTVDGVARLLMHMAGSSEIDTLVDVERWEIGSRTYGLSSVAAALPEGVDQPLASILVELTGLPAGGS